MSGFEEYGIEFDFLPAGMASIRQINRPEPGFLIGIDQIGYFIEKGDDPVPLADNQPFPRIRTSRCGKGMLISATFRALKIAAFARYRVSKY